MQTAVKVIQIYLWFPVVSALLLFLSIKSLELTSNYFYASAILALLVVIYSSHTRFLNSTTFKPKWWVVGMVVAMLILLILGTQFLSMHFREKTLDFRLNDCSDPGNLTVSGINLNCYGVDKKALQGQKVTCSLNNNAKLIDGLGRIELHNGSDVPFSYNNSISLVIPENTVKVEFNMNVTNDNKSLCLSTSRSQIGLLTREQDYE